MGLQMNRIGKEVLCTVLPEFFKAREYVELAYLFGSTAEETEGPLSDIDIGVYLSGKLTKGERIEKRLELMGELSTLLKTDHVDLLVMNDAAPVINFEVIRPNVPLFVRNEDLKLDVEQHVMSRYLDRKYHEEFLNRELLKRIREKRGIPDVSSR
jgi:predicted nucleotidyltransferase